GHLLIVSLAAVAPYMSLAVLLALGAMARTWERTHRSVSAQRMRGVTGSGPVWRAGLAGPFRALLGLLEIALQALLPLILGVLVGIALDAGWTLLQGSAPPDGAAFALAMAITLLITWVGLGSATTRNGAHRMLDAAAPDRLWGGGRRLRTPPSRTARGATTSPSGDAQHSARPACSITPPAPRCGPLSSPRPVTHRSPQGRGGPMAASGPSQSAQERREAQR